MRHQQTSIWCGVVFYICLICISRALCQLGQPKSADVVSALIESERKIRDVQAHFSAVHLEKEFLSYEYDWGNQGGKEFMRGRENYTQTMNPDDTKVYNRVDTETAFDGEKTYFWRHDLAHKELGRPSRGAVSPLEGSVFKYVLTPNVLMGFSIHEKGRLSCGEAIAQADSYSVCDQLEIIDGHPCYVVEVRGVERDPEVSDLVWDARVWLDSERDLRPLKVESYYGGVEGKNKFAILHKRIDAIKLKKINGIWFPVEGVGWNFAIESVEPPSGISREEFSALPTAEQRRLGTFKIMKEPYTRKVEVDPNSIKINDGLEAEKFTVKFPLGCRVYDEFTQTSYVVGGKDEITEPTLDAVRNVTRQVPSNPTESRRETRREDQPDVTAMNPSSEAAHQNKPKERAHTIEQLLPVVVGVAIVLGLLYLGWVRARRKNRTNAIG